jgi:hypothetical protein
MNAPPCLKPSSLGALRTAILTAIAELADAREEVSFALSMHAGQLYVDEAAVIDTVLPTMEAAERDITAALRDMREARRLIAEARGEAQPAPDNVTIFPGRGRASGGPDAVA